MQASSPDSQDLYRVGQLAKQTSKTVRAIRFYEELGLLDPVGRTKGGFRQYDNNALVRIHWIDRLQELGFSLKDIRDFLVSIRGEESGPVAMVQLHSSYAQKLDEIRVAIRRFQALERELEDAIDYLSTCQTCAPSTGRSACFDCNETAHIDVEPPVMVAAVQEPL